MKKIEVSHIGTINQDSPLSRISGELDNLRKNLIDEAPWREFPYKPEVSFTIAYNDCIFLKYYVTERSVRATCTKANDLVYKDSCVEFFISFNGGDQYYNLEFNCTGACLLGYGSGRSGRSLLPQDLIKTIQYRSDIVASNTAGAAKVHWELTLMIPLIVFSYTEPGPLHGLLCKGNFFKCGDEADEPHFLSWNNITADSPDFHLPVYFGDIHFF